MAGLLILAVALGWIAGPLPDALGFWTDPIILEFVFGMLLAVAARSGLRLRPATAVFLMGAGLFALALALPMRMVMGLPRGLAWGFPVALFVTGAVLGDFRRSQGALARALGAIGDASYSLYLLHPFVIRFFREFWSRGLIDAAAWPWAYAALVVAAAIAAALVTYRLFERPVTQALQGLMSRPARDVGDGGVGRAAMSAGAGGRAQRDVALFALAPGLMIKSLPVSGTSSARVDNPGR